MNAPRRVVSRQITSFFPLIEIRPGTKREDTHQGGQMFCTHIDKKRHTNQECQKTLGQTAVSRNKLKPSNNEG